MKSSGERFVFWLVVFLLIFGSVLLIIRSIINSNNIPLPNELTENDWIKGNPDAEIILIEYSDFQCPFCALEAEYISEIIAEFGNYIQFTYRHYPLKSIHPNATLAAQAAEAAGLQGKFWEMHDILFTYQSSWSSLSIDQAESEFIKYATDIDIDPKQFLQDLNSKKVEKLVDYEYESAIKGDLTGTPTIFLNAEKIQNPQNVEDFRTIIRQAIEQNK
jgi:protein-disulfide isomerase